MLYIYIYIVYTTKMKKKVIVVGTSGEVTQKLRPNINLEFDEIIIMNRSIFHLESHKEYFGIPTIWANCGWYTKDDICNPPEEKLNQIEEILANSKIKEVWLNSTIFLEDLGYKIPKNIMYRRINTKFIEGHSYHSLGLQTLLYCSENENYETYYFGMDSYRKTNHYYEDNEKNDITYSRLASSYILENKYINLLIESKKIKKYA